MTGVQPQRITTHEYNLMHKSAVESQKTGNWFITRTLITKLSMVCDTHRNKELREIVGALVFNNESEDRLGRYDYYSIKQRVFLFLCEERLTRLLGVTLEDMWVALDTMGDVCEFLALNENLGYEFNVRYETLLLFSVFSRFPSVGIFDEIFGEGEALRNPDCVFSQSRRLLVGYLGQGESFFSF